MKRVEALKKVDDIMGNATVFQFIHGHVTELINQIFEEEEAKGKMHDENEVDYIKVKQ